MIITNPSVDTLHEGEVFKARLTLWPYEGKDDQGYKLFKNKTFLDFFYVIEVSSVQRSKNNSDVLEIDLLMLLSKAFENRSFFIFQHGNLNIPIEIRVKELRKHKSKITKFIMWDIDLKEKSLSIYILYFILLILLVLMIISYRKRIKNKKNVKSNFDELKISQLLKSSSRKEYEELYKYRKELRLKYSNAADEIRNFLDTMEQQQYKKEWTENEEKKIHQLITTIREKQ